MRSPVVEICDKLHFVSVSANEAQKSDFCIRNSSHFIEIGGANAVGEFDFLEVSVIHAFCDMFSAAQKVDCDAIVVCPENDDCRSICTSCLLLGAYLILQRDMKVEEVLDLFEETINEVLQRFQCQTTSYLDIITKSWKALEYAKGLNWLFPSNESESDTFLEIELHTHYASEANGNIHTLVPGKLLLFPTPCHLPGGRSWADLCEPGSTTRRFSAEYLGELLLELDVSVVVSLDQASSATTAAFLQCGLDVHDLCLDPHLPSLLSAIDRILALTRAAPGAVAIFCGGDGSEVWSSHIRTLAAAYLMSDFDFDAGAADAWLRMLCPRLAGGCRL